MTTPEPDGWSVMRVRRVARAAKDHAGEWAALARAIWWTAVSIAKPPPRPPISDRDRRRIAAEYDQFTDDVIRFEERKHTRWV